MGNLKIASASQAIPINKYKNMKEKVWKFNVNIYFNKQCLTSKGCDCLYKIIKCIIWTHNGMGNLKIDDGLINSWNV
jgi:hypothetical protein